MDETEHNSRSWSFFDAVKMLRVVITLSLLFAVGVTYVYMRAYVTSIRSQANERTNKLRTETCTQPPTR